MVTSRSKRKTNKAGAKMLTLKLQNVESTNQMGDSDQFYIKSMSRHKNEGNNNNNSYRN